MKRLFPFSKWTYNLLIAVPAFLLGACFDLTKFRLDLASSLAGSGLFLTLARVLGGLFLAFFALMLLRCGRELLGLGRIDWRQAVILIIALNALTALYVLTSRTVYVWDGAGYWLVARNLSQQWLGRSQLFEVLQSTIHLDYNYLLAFPISLIMRVFGGNRAVFLFSVTNLYTLPAVWALCVLGKRRKGGGLILSGLFAMLVYTGLAGFVDTAACALALWAYIIYESDRPPVSRGFFAGALLVGSFLLRRYFFFFAASFGVAALVKKLAFERKDWRDFGALFGSCALFALYFTPNFLLDKVLGTNYNDLYSAYDLGLWSDVRLFCRYFGVVLFLVLAALTISALVRGENRSQIVMPLVQIVVCYLAFVSVQTHGQQHLLIYLPALAVLSTHLILPVKGFAAPALAAFTVFNCLIPKAQPASIAEIKRPDLLPSFTFYGPKREDIDSLLELNDYINSLSSESPKSATVLSSSFIFNSETLTNLLPSLNLPQPQTTTEIWYHGTVDKRDAFNWNTATADYLIVGDPVQVHLGEENQQIMSILVHDVLEGVGPGRAYTPLPQTFTLQGGAIVRIYRRDRDWTYEEYQSISQRLIASYPNYAQLYDLPEWLTP